MSKYTQKGRVLYIDPNETEDGSGARNVIDTQYEDMNIFVDLSVIANNRSGEEIEGVTYTFLGSKYFSTDYSNLHEGGEPNIECLGMKSLNIIYNTWFYPQITLELSDTRGASLCIPEGNDSISKNEFLSKLFMLPSPLFRLRIKGFYGGTVTYSLNVSSFKGSLNPSTGNFDITIQFIGNMYGLYGDTPVSYITAAPYMSYHGAQYWSSSQFKDNEGIDIMKFSKLVNAIESGQTAVEASTKDTSKGVLDDNHLEEAIAALENVKEKRESFLNATFTKYGYSERPEDSNIEPNEIFTYCLGKEVADYIGEKAADCGYNSLRTAIITYNGEDSSYSASELEKVKSFRGVITMQDNKPLMVLSGTGKNILDLLENSDMLNEEKAAWKRFINEDVKKIGKQNIYLYRNICPSLQKSLSDANKRIMMMTTRVNEEKSKISLSQQIANTLGFRPSIENIFRCSFAHMDTFMHVFGTCVKNIKDSNRKLSSIGWKKSATDVKSGSEEYFPPFVGFIREETTPNGDFNNENPSTKKVYIWPGDIPGGENLEEVKFVESLLEASLNAEALSVGGDKAILTDIQPETMSCLPTTFYDVVHTDDMPYSHIANGVYKRDEYLWQYTFLTFALRYYQYIIDGFFTGSNFNAGTPENDTSDALKSGYSDLFGKLEAYNFYNSNTNLSIDDLNQFSEEKFLDFIKSTENEGNIAAAANSDKFKLPLFTDGKKEGTLKYNWGNTVDSQVEHNYIPLSVKDPRNITIAYTPESTTLVDSLNIWGHQKNLFAKFEPTALRNIVNEVVSRTGCDAKLYTQNVLKGVLMGEDGLPLYTDDKIKEEVTNFSKNFKKLIYSLYRTSDDEYYNAIFGTKYFYAQNNTGTEEEKRIRKAYVFLKGMDCIFYDDKDDKKLFGKSSVWKKEEETYAQILRRGAAEWLGDDTSKLIDWTETIAPCENKAYADYAKKEFLSWANGDFKKILEAFEIRDDENHLLTSESFVEFVKDNAEKTSSKKKSRIALIQDAYKNSKETYAYYNKETIILDNPEIPDTCVDVFTRLLRYVPIINVVNGFQPLNGKKLPTLSEASLRAAFKSFKTTLEDSYKNNGESKSNVSTDNSSTIARTVYDNNDLKLSIYLTLKSIYDKWQMGINPEKWELDNPNSEFSSFRYVDGFLRDIGNRLPVNLIELRDLIQRSTSVMGKTTSEINSLTMYSFLSEICTDSKCLLLAFPVGTMFREKNNTTGGVIEDYKRLFDTQQFVSGKKDDISSTYVCIYPGQPASKLKIPDPDGTINFYKDDGFKIANNGEIEGIGAFQDDGYLIPAFSVDYAKQNQGIFKNISVSMDNPQTTDASITATFSIASQNGKQASNALYASQDMYGIYGTYAYSCTVEMLGDMQITPLMYFQLNNCFLFSGAYQIIKVEHNIEPGNITTKFTGVKVSLEEIPIADALPVGRIPNARSIHTDITSNPQPSIDSRGIYEQDTEEPGIYPGDEQYEANSDGDANTGHNWKAWVASLKKGEDNYFCFGQSVYNRMKYYCDIWEPYMDEKRKSKAICGSAVKEYVECCLHRQVGSGWNGWSSYQQLENLGYECITDLTAMTYTHPDGTVIDLKTDSGRQAFTRKYALNGDVCCMRQANSCQAGKSQEGYKIGHIAMFINDSTLSDVPGGPLWVSDGKFGVQNQQSCGWCYGKCAVDKIGIWRHKKVVASTASVDTMSFNTFEVPYDLQTYINEDAKDTRTLSHDKYVLSSGQAKKYAEIAKKIMDKYGISREIACCLAGGIGCESGGDWRAVNKQALECKNNNEKTWGWLGCDEGLCQIATWDNKKKVIENAGISSLSSDPEVYKLGTSTHISSVNEDDGWKIWYTYFTTIAKTASDKIMNESLDLTSRLCWTYLYKAGAGVNYRGSDDLERTKVRAEEYMKTHTSNWTKNVPTTNTFVKNILYAGQISDAF